jgi:hypothetical protein
VTTCDIYRTTVRENHKDCDNRPTAAGSVGDAIQFCDSHYVTWSVRTLGRQFRVIASSTGVVLEFISSYCCIVANLVKMSGIDINKELLIALIEERPVLWDKSNDI